MSTRNKLELKICRIILSMERPFKISQLFQEMDKNGITDRDLVLEILSQLCELGVIKYSEIENDVWAYRRRVQYA